MKNKKIIKFGFEIVIFFFSNLYNYENILKHQNQNLKISKRTPKELPRKYLVRNKKNVK